MTDRERLTALLMAGAGDCLGKGGTLNCTKLAEYLIEHGVVVPPCKIGDTVYINNHAGLICEGRIRTIVYDTGDFAFGERAIGKNVFPTREEAERALKERENNA